jgi:hypothetical protein
MQMTHLLPSSVNKIRTQMPFCKFLKFLCISLKIFFPKNTDGRMRKEYRILANFPAPCASLAANRRPFRNGATAWTITTKLEQLLLYVREAWKVALQHDQLNNATAL